MVHCQKTTRNIRNQTIMPKITLTVNNQSVTKDVEGRTLLVELICEGLGLMVCRSVRSQMR